MADTQRERTSGADEKKAVEDLPPPPPLPHLQDSPTAPGIADSGSLPLPPPKESFSKFYQQRQVNELKRLYRHMHPELRKNLEEAVSEDLAEMLSPDDPNEPVMVTPDVVVPGEVQSMRWIFENWSLDSIGERQAAKNLAEDEAIPSGDVKNRSMKFEGQPSHGDGLLTSAKASGLQETKGDVRTARWLFETQPLDSLNKMYLDETDVQETLLKEPVERGDVKGAAQLFETHSLEALGHCNSVEEENILQLKSEIQELKGDVKKTIKLFQTEPICALQDKTGSIHEIKSICREETQTNTVKTARWLFETQPLDTINKDTSKVQVIRGISLEEAAKGNVSGTKWVFETQPLDAIKEFTVSEADFKASPDLIQGADVSKQCLLFETQPLDSLKGESSSSPPAKEEVIKGDVKSTLWLFETQPMETLRDHLEVGPLKKVELSKDEKGAVKQTKHLFETCPFESISKSPAEDFCTTPVQEIEKGDVKAFKNLFETLPLDSIRQVSTEEITKGEEDILSEQVRSNHLLLESTPLYAIKDCFGHFHQVTSVSRDEEVTSGGVKNYKWMFETKPLDEFDGSIQKVDVIKGITKQEIMAGDVQTAKWLFETQPIDVIHSQVNQEEQNISEKREIFQGGDVKTCRWLFETQPIDALCKKDEMKENQEDLVPQADVKSYTWMFETQPLDTLKGQEEQHLQIRKTFRQEELQGVDVKTVRHLFEMEPLSSNVPGNSQKIIRCSSRVEIQSGEVSRVKEFFEAKPMDTAAKSRTVIKESPVDGNIEPGAVPKFTWLFENCPMDTWKSSAESVQETTLEKNIQGGDVRDKRFIFETFSLSQIHEKENEALIQNVHEETSEKANVNSCIMLFETQPLYAIQDKDGGYHEVTSVKKEEVIKGDVKGARWQFETKPLDQIKKDDEVFVIRAVTQEDFKKGDVQSARWRFETEPLNSIAEEKRPTLKSVEDIQKGDVQSNKQHFESEQLSQKKYVRMVSVSDVQQGDVRTSTWLFENQPMDTLKGDSEDASSLTTVQREDIHKGDVKRCTWLFETQPMDSLKDPEASTSTESLKGIPQACVKSTTWLFESTPLDKFSSLQGGRETEAKEKTSTDTLELLFSHQLIQKNGILIEANNTEGIKMVTYQLSNQEAPQVQKEKIVEDNLQVVLLQLLQNSNMETRGLLVREEDNGAIKTTPVQLLDTNKAEKSEEDMRNDMARTLQELLNQEISVKKGIVMQETDTGSTTVTIYSLHQRVAEQHTFVKGDVKSVIGNLLTSSQEQRTTATVRREDNEKGNVQLYTRCIEKGDLDYLKNLQRESEIESLVSSQAKEELPKIGQEVTASTLVQNKEDMMTADVIQRNHNSAEQAFLWKTQEDTSEREPPKANHHSYTPCHLVHCGTPSPSRENVVPPPVTLPFQLVEGAQNSGQRTPGQQIILEDGKERTSVQVADQKMVEMLHSFKTGEINSTTVQSPTQVPGNDFQAAMYTLRKATAEAKTLQQQVQSKLQKMTDNMQLSGTQPCAATMQSTIHKEGCEASKQQPVSQVSSSRRQEAFQPGVSLSQKSPASLPLKVSDPEDGQGGTKPFGAHQAGQVLPRTDLSIKDGLYAAKPVKSYVNPFLESDYQEHSVPEEREQDVIIGGDVRTAIRALQNAATEQRQVEKEDVVRGNLKATLESLEKSNINVSQGDFKAAMIYRNAGQSHSMGKKKQEVECVSDQTVTVAPAGSRDVNDFPPPPPPPLPASLMRPDVHAVSSQPREAEVRCCSPSRQPCDLKTPVSSPTKASHQRPSEKPQLPPKPDVIVPPRKKPIIPPKPEFLLKEGPLHPASGNRGQPGKTPRLPSPSKSPILIEQNKPTMNQACGGEIWGQLECKEDSATCPSPIVTNVEDISVEKKSIKDITKLPLQDEEDKSKARKEKRDRVDLTGHSSLLEAIKTGLDSSQEGNCYLTKDFQGFQETSQKEKRGVLSEKQDPLTSFECQMNLPNLEVHRKPYLSAKCHANVLRKGTVVTQVTSSSKSETTSMESQTDKPASAVLVSSDLEGKQVLTRHQTANRGSSKDPEIKNDWNTEKGNPVVVMREKVGKETEEERRKRLSVHKEEIMKGNVKEAMEIFENLRKQEALEEILTQVKEFEEETSKVDVKALRNLFENVADWVVDEKPQQTKQPKVEKAEQLKELREDSESVSSVELAFEDLERASAEIVHLKEQTLSRLLDIEDAIKKALYSISSLKSESDIAGLSGLLKESLGNSQNLTAGNNIRKISIISSKAKQEKGTPNSLWEGEKMTDQHEVPKLSLELPHVIQPRSSSPSSPSYISIQSAARRSTESPQIVPLVSSHPIEVATERETFSPSLFSSLPSKPVRSDPYSRTLGEGDQEIIQIKKGGSLIKQQQLSSPGHLAQHLNTNGTKEKEKIQGGASSDYNPKTSLSALSPSNARRQKSILELQTSHDGSKLYGATRTVTEQYEEVDEFGNKIITSSTTVTKQSETQTSSTCDMVSCPTRYEVTASPILRRYLNSPANFPSGDGHQETGVVFVTFSNSKPVKK